MKALSINSVVLFGSYSITQPDTKEPVKWIVKEIADNRILLVAKNGIDTIPYNEKLSVSTWETSSIRHFLNDDFYNACFSDAEKAAIIEMEHINPDNPIYPARGGEPSNGGKNTVDRIFLLTVEEMEKYFPDKESRRIIPTPYSLGKGAFTDKEGYSSWWLRTPGMRQIHTLCSRFDGSIVYSGIFANLRDVVVRPAVWVDMEKISIALVSDDDADEFKQIALEEVQENESEEEKTLRSKKAFIIGIAGLIVNVVSMIVLILGYLTPLFIPLIIVIALIIGGLILTVIGFVKNLGLIKEKMNLWGFIISLISLMLSLNMLGAVYFLLANHVWSGLFRT